MRIRTSGPQRKNCDFDTLGQMYCLNYSTVLEHRRELRASRDVYLTFTRIQTSAFTKSVCDVSLFLLFIWRGLSCRFHPNVDVAFLCELFMATRVPGGRENLS